MSSAHEDRLRRMLEDGRLTPDQYDELLANLPESNEGPQPVEPRNPQTEARPREAGATIRQLPWPVIACAVLLLFGTLLDAALSRFTERKLIGYTLQIVLAVGLLRSWRWAWVGTAILMSANFLVIIRFMIERERIIWPFFLYVVFLTCLGLAFKHFFPEPLEIKLHRWRKLSSPLVMAQKSPWMVQAVRIYLMVIAMVDLFMGWTMYPILTRLAEGTGRTLRDMRFGPFVGMTPAEGTSAAIICVVVLLGLTYRIRWVFVVMLMLSVFGLGYDVLMIMKNVEWILLVPIVMDVAVIGLLLKAWDWFMDQEEAKQNRIDPATGRLGHTA